MKKYRPIIFTIGISFHLQQLGAADKWMMVTILGWWPQGHHPRVVSIIHLSPGSTKPSVHTIRICLGGPSSRSFPLEFTMGWPPLDKVRLRQSIGVFEGGLTNIIPPINLSFLLLTPLTTYDWIYQPSVESAYCTLGAVIMTRNSKFNMCPSWYDYIAIFKHIL